MAGFHARHPWRSIPEMFLMLLLYFLHLALVSAQPAQLQYQDCSSSSNTSQKLSISTVYAQLFEIPHGALLNFTVLGSTPETILEASNSSNPVASECLTAYYYGDHDLTVV